MRILLCCLKDAPVYVPDVVVSWSQDGPTGTQTILKLELITRYLCSKINDNE